MVVRISIRPRRRSISAGAGFFVLACDISHTEGLAQSIEHCGTDLVIGGKIVYLSEQGSSHVRRQWKDSCGYVGAR